MTKPSVVHATFTIERSYDAAPARVFAAWANPAAKARWFAGPEDWDALGHELDFRIGGRERAGGGPPGGTRHRYEALYQDIVADRRIVTTYEMYMDEVRTSVSVATIEFMANAGGTRLVYTEQGAFLDGHDHPAAREQGTRGLLDALGAELDAAA